MQKIKTNPITPELIAPCGIDCRLCRAYNRVKNPCPGCRIDDPFKPKTRVICRVKICEKRGAAEIQWCFDCEEFPCAHLARLDKRYRTRYRMSLIANLLSIQETGLQNFIEDENKKWTCPGCGRLLCMHEPACLSCGYLWEV